MGEARRRRLLAKQIPFPGTLAHAMTPGYGAPYKPGKQLTEQQQTAALVMYLFAVLTWNPDLGDDDDDERWTTHCMNKYAYHPNQNSFEACVWWAMRHEDKPSLRDAEWLGYLAHVCRNHGILAR